MLKPNDPAQARRAHGVRIEPRGSTGVALQRLVRFTGQFILCASFEELGNVRRRIIQLKFNFGLIDANVYPLTVAKSKPDLRLSKGRFEFRGPVTPGDGSGATSDKPNCADENLQSSYRLPIRTSKNVNLQPSSEKNVISYTVSIIEVNQSILKVSLCGLAPEQSESQEPTNNIPVCLPSFFLRTPRINYPSERPA